MPFVFSDVRLYRDAGSSLRVRLSGPAEAPSLVAVDDSGEPVFSIGSMQMRPLEPAQLRSGGRLSRDGLYALRWVEVPAPSNDGQRPGVAALGDSETMKVAGLDAACYPDLAALEEAVAEGGGLAPAVVVAEVPVVPAETEVALAAHQLTERTLDLLQAWLGSSVRHAWGS